MLRRVFLILTLALLFGLGQQGAAVHALSHYADAQEQQQDKAHHGTACDKCIAYAELAGALPSSACPLPPGAARQAALDHRLYRAHALAAAAYSARAPPTRS